MTSAALAERYPRSSEVLAAALLDARHRALAPSPKLSLSEWVDAHGVLSSESSAEPGEFKAFGYQRGLLDAFSDPENSVVAVMKSARVGYTQLASFALGYYLEHDPTTVLFVLPTEDNVSDFMKDSILPMFRDTVCLSEIQGGGVSDDDKFNKFTAKGSVLRARGAHSADTFRRITSRINIGDEIDADGWGAGATRGQGDKIRLLRKRGETYWNAKLILGSTPLIKGLSRIEDWFERGDQRRYFVPCPHCSAASDDDPRPMSLDGFQTLRWGDGVSVGIDYKTDPENPTYVCEHCGTPIEETWKPWMDAHGEWRATAEGEKGIASYHVSALYSLFPNASWRHLAAEWIEAQGDPDKLQPFVNLVLGESWEDRSAARQAEPHELQERSVMDYGAEIPPGVRLTTWGVDAQSKDGGRFEATLYGWGAGEKGAAIGHFILDEHPLKDPAAWEALAALLSRGFRTVDGRQMFASAAAIDSGGHYTQEAYQFGQKHAGRNWWAIKGHSRKGEGLRGDSIWPRQISKDGKVYSVDVDIAKDVLFRRLHDDPEKPGGLVFPELAPEGSVPFDRTFFTRLSREKPRPVRGQPGKTHWKQQPGDQEPWDCLIYAYAALQGLKMRSARFAAMVATPRQPRPVSAPQAAEATPEAQTPAATPAPAQLPRPKPAARRKAGPVVKRSSWLS